MTEALEIRPDYKGNFDEIVARFAIGAYANYGTSDPTTQTDPTYLRGKIEDWKRISDADDARIASLSAQRDVAFGVALALLAIAALLAMGAVM